MTTEATATQGERMQELHRGLLDVFENARELDAIYEATGGEVDWRTEQWQSWLDSSSGQTVEALCHFHAEAIAVAETAKKEIKRLREVVDRQENREEWAKDRLYDVLQTLGVKRYEIGTRLVYIKKQPGHVEQCGELNLALLDPELVKEVPATLEPKLTPIGARLKKGETVDGFKWVDGGEGVVIK